MEWREQLFARPRRKAPTVITYLNQNAIPQCVRVQADIAMRMREFKCVLEQVSHCSEQQIVVRFDSQQMIHIGNEECASTRLGFEGRRTSAKERSIRVPSPMRLFSRTAPVAPVNARLPAFAAVNASEAVPRRLRSSRAKFPSCSLKSVGLLAS
jgi:hypothetical protein